MKRFLVLFPVVLLLALGAYGWVVVHWSYSTGDRAGWMQKFSRKGWVCKTWEGELAMSAVPGSVPDRFFFTVRDDEVASKLEQAVGQRLRLHYEQHRGLPGDCLGETEYWVDSFEVVPDAMGQTLPSVNPAPASPVPTPAAPVAPSAAH